jgi:hypothetical protein
MPLNAVTLKAAFLPVMTVSYAILGGGTPSAPTFNYVLNGAVNSLTLTTTAQTVSVDLGSAWSVTPNPLGGSSSSQQWYSTQALTGTASASTIVFIFQHQFYLTMQVNPSGTGSTTPSTSGWYNAGQKVTIGATAKSGYNFLSWAGSGAGSYSGICSVAGCSSAAAVTMNAPITETANFEQTSS